MLRHLEGPGGNVLTADLLTSLLGTVTATETSLTRSASVVGRVRPMPTDGICDDVDPCVGELDACGIYNSPGATYDSGCSGIPAGTATATETSLTRSAMWWAL